MSKYLGLRIVVLFYCSATAKLWYMSECLADRLEHSISVYLVAKSAFKGRTIYFHTNLNCIEYTP